jgi:hypothetical protein
MDDGKRGRVVGGKHRKALTVEGHLVEAPGVDAARAVNLLSLEELSRGSW